jgi:hypothetical protein
MKQIDYTEEFMVMLHLIDVTAGTIGKHVENVDNALQVISDSMVDNKFKEN